MKCLILAAGYATRLYPLTENFPKPLLDINGKSILDWILEDVEANIEIEQYIIVSNHKFVEQFQNWKDTLEVKNKTVIIDDGSTENDNRLGAVKDIAFAIEQMSIDDDLMVLAGDNLLDFSLKGFVEYFKRKNATCIMRHYEPEVSKLQRTGVANIDTFEKVIEMQEKPKVPKSNWAVPPFYLYKKEDLKYILQGINEDCDTDAPGSFIAWLCNKCDVYAYEMPGKRFDIGNLESYRNVQAVYQGVQ